MDNFLYFRETSNLNSPSCLLQTDVTAPLNTTWFGQFWPKPGAIKLSCTAVSLGNRILRRYFNRITISYKCGKWLIRFAKKKRMRKNFDCFFLSDDYLSPVWHGLSCGTVSHWGWGWGGEGHHNFIVIAPMIMKFGTGIKLDVSPCINYMHYP